MNLLRTEHCKPQFPQHPADSALAELPTPLRVLNQVYMHNVENRTLADATHSVAWVGRKVTVFLRHDRVRVFAIVSEDQVGMADYVQLSDVRFHVDPVGRSQSVRGEGPLPNHRTIHAYLTGRMLSVADHGRLPDTKAWESIEYRPAECDTFFRTHNRSPIVKSDLAWLVPGPRKVWCPCDDARTRNMPSGDVSE